ncbi:hypothetical protein [Longimicrobium sp.]|jgi:ribosomal silencing factor RsfS|uniref:hypothetical protein n=1 Tax=Longimicrobium sp. TaxID=2029185 RepID=UPI002ED946F2
MDEMELLAMAEQLKQTLSGLSDVMKGQVQGLMAEGWTEVQAKEVVVAMMVGALRGQR